MCLLLALAACSGDSKAVDASLGVCAGSAYDPCNDEDGCPLVDTPTCNGICTQACGSDLPACPDNGVGNRGICVNGFCAADRGDCTAQP